MATENGRAALLAEYGHWYGQQRFAVAFTASTSGDDAKRINTRGWDKTMPLSDGPQGAAYVHGRGQTKNPAIVLRPSNLIVLECDTEDDLLRIQALKLPETVTVRSSKPYKRHYYFRPAPELEALPYVAFRFESGKLTADSGRYFLAPPAIHPTGAVYSFLPGLGPEHGIATLPETAYRQLTEQARTETNQLRGTLEIDPDAKIKAGNRREMLFKFACMQRRWTANRELILAATLAYNEQHCEPPVERHLVAVQVDGAMKKTGGQELAANPANSAAPAVQAVQAVQEAFRLVVRTSREIANIPDPDDEDLLLGPLVARSFRTIVVGDTGHGKTSFCLQMCRAILDSDDMLNHTGAGAGPVLIVDLEQGMRSVKRGLREAQLHDRDDVLHISVPDGLALDKDPEHLAELNRVVTEHKPAVVLLDPYYKAHRADDSNQERPIIDLMRHLDALRAEHGFALILPAHPRKELAGKEGARKLTLHDIAGSGAVTRGAEIILGIERLAHGYARLRYLKDREGDLPIGEHVSLLYDKEHGFRLDPREDESDEAIEARILATASDWKTGPEWSKELKVRRARMISILAQLAESGKVAFMKGPPGRSPSAQCYGTIPKCWEQSGIPGIQGSFANDSETIPTVPPPVRGRTEWEQSNDAHRTIPGTDHPTPDDDFPA